MKGNGPFYCPGDEAVYLDLLQAQVYYENGLGVLVWGSIAHEAGHHVQGQLGLLGEACTETPCSPDQWTSRQVENMADCFAGAWTGDAEREGQLGQTDLANLIANVAHIGDPTIGAEQGQHGSSAERASWFLEGYWNGAQACL